MKSFKELFDHKSTKTLLYICAIKFPKCSSLSFPFYMFLIYVQIYYKRKRFQVKLVPYKLMKQIIACSKDGFPTDINNTVIVNSQTVTIMNLGRWAKLKLIDEGKLQSRLVYVMGSNVNANQIVVSDTIGFNCEIKQNSKNVAARMERMDNILTFASHVDISLISTEHDVINAVTDELLNNYFKAPKFVKKGDIVQISMKDYCPKYYYTHNKINEIEFVHFKCNKVKYNEEFDSPNCHLCCSDKTTLKQSANTQSFLIPTESQLRKIEHSMHRNSINIDECIINNCPTGLQNYLKEIEDCTTPFLEEPCPHLKPIFLIKGPRGVGKLLLIKSLANKFGLNLLEVNPIEVQSQTYVQTEIKIRNFILKAKLCSPCILSISQFENFGKNNEGQYDLRIINTFKSELENLFLNNNYPILLICSTNLQDIPPDLSRLFLDTIEIKAPSINERCDLMTWILNKNCVRYDSDLNQIANKTNGFLFEDLKALIYYAHKACLNANSNTNLVQTNHFESALDIMQNKYTDSLGVPKVPKVEWSDVGALNDVKHEIIRTIELPLKHPNVLKSTGLKRSGILLYGPPGTGKTLLAKAVATECGLCFLSVKGPELLNMYVGQSEQNVREVFEKARQASPCIVFFDELDSLAPNRGMAGDSGGVMDRVVSQLLAEMDGLDQSGTIFIIGATNRPDLIDPALLRPGRFDKLLYVGPCVDFESKLGVLKALTRRFKLAKNVNFEEIVKACPATITGADFYGLCSSAWMLAAKKLIKNIEDGKISNWDSLTHEDVVVDKSNFIEAVKAVKPSVSPEDLLYFSQLKY